MGMEVSVWWAVVTALQKAFSLPQAGGDAVARCWRKWQLSIFCAKS
jgi:hypothetical protein